MIYRLFWVVQMYWELYILQVFDKSQQLYGSVTLVLRTALLDRYDLPPTTSRDFLSHSPMIVFKIVF